jgi:hypothetical protein
LSAHVVPGGVPVNGLLLGYAQVPAERMDALVARLAGVVPAVHSRGRNYHAGPGQGQRPCRTVKDR